MHGEWQYNKVHNTRNTRIFRVETKIFGNYAVEIKTRGFYDYF